MSNEIFKKYIDVSAGLDGWFDLGAQYIWDFLLDFQSSMSVCGNTMEIGVYQGKSAALIALHTSKFESAVFCDKFFDDSTRSILTSLSQCTPIFLEKKSYSISSTADLNNMQHTFRFIHIDGGHTAGQAYGDLKLADEMLSEEGIICLDDFFSPKYPQITEMVFSYISSNRHSLTLFLCGFRKAFLARPHIARAYQSHMYEQFQSYLNDKHLDRPVTLFKTSPPGDMNCLGVDYDYSGDGPYRGQDEFFVSGKNLEGFVF